MNNHKTGVGIADILNLRVSVASLVRVLFNHPEDRRKMIALERIATLRDIEGEARIEVKVKPFGGGVRLTDPQALKELIGIFHYDSERSSTEHDFRILIKSTSWNIVKKICREHWRGLGKGILDPSPDRELAEEFEDSLHVKISTKQYHLKPKWMIMENLPVKTTNVNAQGLPTVRIYYVFDAHIEDTEIINMIMNNNVQFSNSDLQKMAWEEFRQGGKGRANAILVLGLNELNDLYSSIRVDNLTQQINFKEHQLDGNIPAILEGIHHSKYHRYITNP